MVFSIVNYVDDRHLASYQQEIANWQMAVNTCIKSSLEGLGNKYKVLIDNTVDKRSLVESTNFTTK